MSCTYKYQGKEYLESELSDLISSIDKGTIFKKEVLDDDTKFILQDISTAIVNDKDYTFIKLDNVFTVEFGNIGEVAKATLSKDGYLDNIRVNDKYRRLGIANSLYDYIENIEGISLKPSPIKISQEARSLWNKRQTIKTLLEEFKKNTTLIKNNSKNLPNIKSVQTNIQTDSEYLLNDFVADFAAEKLKNPTEFNRQFKITETGIELASNDIITLETVKAYIQDGAKYSKEIADYSLLSKDMPNLKEKDSFTIDSVLDKRIKAVNDINSVSKPTTEITIIDEESFSAPNETSQFLRVGDDIFEQQEQGYYNKLQKNINPNFFDLNPQQPEFKNFDIQQEKSSENNPKKLTDKDTDSENFSCLS